MTPEVSHLLIKAEDSFHQGDFNTALKLTDSAAVDAPELADIPYLQGLIFAKVTQLNRAKAAYERVVALDPNYRAAWFKLGNNAFRRYKYGEAVSMYRKEQQLAREKAQASHGEIDLERQRTTLLQLGRAYIELGKVDSAEQAYLQAIAIDGSYAEAYSDLSALHKDNGDYQTAIAYSRKALKLDPETVHHHYFLGLLLAQTGQEQEAIGYLKTAIEQRPWHPGAHYNMGQALIRLGRMEEGRDYLAGIDSIQTLADLIDEAEFTARVNPDVPRRWIKLARLLRRAGRHQEAMDAYDVALYLSPKSVTIQRNVANLSLSLSDTTGAIKRYRAILWQDPSLGEIWVSLGAVYALSGRLEEARQAWQNALRYQPDNVQATAWLAKFQEGP
ncbi:MAG: tetratricopeptide repeat protein [Candidatus Neomarinimicrobiota bacterium]